MTNEVFEAANAYESVLDSLKQENASENIREIMSQLGKKGYIVADINGKYNTVNPERLECFVENMNLGIEDSVAVYEIGDHEKLLAKVELSFQDKQLNVVQSVVKWDALKHKEISFMGSFNAYDWYYTDKGNLIYERYITEDGYDGPQGYYLLRVKPREENYRVLEEKYIMPIGYENNNLFIINWDENHFQKIGFLDLFEVLYGLNEHACMPFSDYEEGIQKKAFENLITTYFKVPLELLEDKSYYNSNQEIYEWHERQINEWNSQPGPVPEVTECRANEDGTLTLSVDAFWIEQRTDCAFKHEVTIRPLKNGEFQYVSNRILEGNHNLFPEYIPRENEDME